MRAGDINYFYLIQKSSICGHIGGFGRLWPRPSSCPGLGILGQASETIVGKTLKDI